MRLPLPTSLRMALLIPSLLGAQESAPERLLASGDRAYAAKAPAEAVESWRHVVQLAPRSPEAAQALLRLARHFLEVDQNPPAALPLLDRLKQEHFTSLAAAEGLLLRGSLLARIAKRPQDLREAMAEFNRVGDLFPGSPQALAAQVLLGQALLDLDQPLKALPRFLEPVQADPKGLQAAAGLLGAATALERLGELPAALLQLQHLRDLHPQSPEADEAQWRTQVLIRHRVQKRPLKSQGPWPQGRTRWLKTPTLLAQGAKGELYVYQDGLDLVSRVVGTQLEASGPSGSNAKALLGGFSRSPWLAIPKVGLVRDDGSTLALPGLVQPSGGFRDRWGTLWVGDAKTAALLWISPEGTVRTLPSPATAALAALPNGGAVLASDANRSLHFLDSTGQTQLSVPYGKDMPAAFRSVLALASDPLGHLAGLVEGGDFEGVVVWGPDGSLLRQASFKELGVSGRFRAIALDRQGGLILADRTNDLLVRIE